jgi:hypothetical protein
VDCRGEKDGVLEGVLQIRETLLQFGPGQLLVVVSSTDYRDFAPYAGAYLGESNFPRSCIAESSAAFPMNALFTIHDYRFPILYLSPGSGEVWERNRQDIEDLVADSNYGNVAVIAPSRLEGHVIGQAIGLSTSTDSISIDLAVASGPREAHILVLDKGDKG